MKTFDEVVQDLLGGNNEAARRLGISRSFCSQIRLGRRPLPLYVAARVRDATNGAVTVADLRPDIAEMLK
jgi:DNA-binding transcriptional regulator YdaS (Cro superfamily)